MANNSDLEGYLMAAQLGRSIGDPIAQGIIRNQKRQQQLQDYSTQRQDYLTDTDKEFRTKAAMAGLDPNYGNLSDLAKEYRDAKIKEADFNIEQFKREKLLERQFRKPDVLEGQGGYYRLNENNEAVPIQIQGAKSSIPTGEPLPKLDGSFPSTDLSLSTQPAGTPTGTSISSFGNQMALDNALRPPSKPAPFVRPDILTTDEGYVSYDPVTGKRMTLTDNSGQPLRSPKKDKGDEKVWDDLLKQSNPRTASSRSALGVVANAHNRAARALDLLNQSDITKQELKTIEADLAGIFQGGAPTEAGLNDQDYRTAYGSVASIIQQWGGNPTDAVPDAIKERLKGVVTRMMNQNKSVFKEQLDFEEAAHPEVISNHSEAWKNVRKNIESAWQSGSSSKDFKSVSEAESAGLPKGTRITVNGRPAITE